MYVYIISEMNKQSMQLHYYLLGWKTSRETLSLYTPLHPSIISAFLVAMLYRHTTNNESIKRNIKIPIFSDSLYSNRCEDL